MASSIQFLELIMCFILAFILRASHGLSLLDQDISDYFLIAQHQLGDWRVFLQYSSLRWDKKSNVSLLMCLQKPQEEKCNLLQSLPSLGENDPDRLLYKRQWSLSFFSPFNTYTDLF